MTTHSSVLAWEIPWAWWATVHGVLKYWTWLRDYTTTTLCGIPWIVWASLVAQLVKNPPAMRETWVQSLGWEDPLEKERLPTPVFWPGEFHGLQSMGSQKVRQDWATFTFTFGLFYYLVFHARKYILYICTQLVLRLVSPHPLIPSLPSQGRSDLMVHFRKLALLSSAPPTLLLDPSRLLPVCVVLQHREGLLQHCLPFRFN